LGGAGNDDAGGGIVFVGGSVYLADATDSDDFPTVNPFQQTRGGGTDGFVTRLVLFISVSIDIKPGSFPNSINLGSGGSVPVAIFSTTTFDATTVDPMSAKLASATVRLKGQGTPMASFADVNDDGLLDLVVHVSTEALQLSGTDTEALLEGQTFSGVPVKGTDSVRVVP
jgi:hypothetical protein